MDPLILITRAPGAVLPEKQTPGSSGWDLCALVEKPIIMPSLTRALISTGIKLIIPPGYEGQIRSRSGKASKHGLVVLNSPGTIDSDYRGEVKVLLFNTSARQLKVSLYDRIAQLIIAPIPSASFHEISDLVFEARPTTGRTGGFGSTDDID